MRLVRPVTDNEPVESSVPEQVATEPDWSGPPRDVVILGSTGSIGTQALDIIRRNPHRFRVVALAAGGANLDLLAQQAAEFGAAAVAVASPAAAAGLQAALRHFFGRTARGAPAPSPLTSPSRTLPDVLAGPDAICDVAAWPADVVLNGVTGAAGLRATLAALDAGRVLALANKESLIVGGPLVTSRAKPGQIVPVDSEHSTLAQCLRAGRHSEVRRLVLTASGGPFRGWSTEQLAHATRADALAHPTWKMGEKITIDSSTLMNKGLEVLEARALFHVPLERIDVVVHPQSIVHSMVEYVDNATIAQLSTPDMRLPIAYALGLPTRLAHAFGRLDFARAMTLEFEPPDRKAFPALDLAYEAGRRGGAAPAWLSAANEVAVSAFLRDEIAWTDIVAVTASVLDDYVDDPLGSLDALTVNDARARELARERIARLST